MPKTLHELNITNRRVVFAGGGTGGHLWPLVSIVRLARTKYGVMPIYFGTASKLERRVWRAEGVRQIHIPSGKRRNYVSWRNVFDYFLLLAGVVKALCWLIVLKPALVFGKGGYGMLPTVWAARLLGIPVISHESDIVMGKANRFALSRRSVVLTAFPADFYEDSGQKRGYVRYAGMPVHPDFYEDGALTAGKAGIKKSILVFGGSQGSARVNDIVSRAWLELAELGRIVHITGMVGYRQIKLAHDELDVKIKSRITVYPEVDDLPRYLKQASLVIARGGATSLWEIAAAGVPAIIIPLPEAANDHQRLNAIWFTQEFASITMMEEKNLTPDLLASRARQQIDKKTELEEKNLIMPDMALETVAGVIGEGLVANYLRYTRRFHLVGHLGVSMRGIEHLLRRLGHKTSGSDLAERGHSAKNIKAGLDAVVYSSAAATDNAPGQIEIGAAQTRDIPTIKRSRFIKSLANTSQMMAVAGMHGKSTVASMVAHILLYCGLDPSYLIGVPDTEPKNGYVGGARAGEGNIFVVEACEYDRSFHDFAADVAIITNIEKEHLDYFTGGLEEIEQTFAEFLTLARPGAWVIALEPDSSTKRVLAKVARERPDIKIVKSADDEQNIESIDWKEYQFFGRHNIGNAQAAVAAVRRLGITPKEAWASLRSFKGARRRLEYMGTFKEAVVYDDYGHHPTEIAADISALREKYPKRKLMVVFQPHQVSRTKLLFDDFVTALSGADNIVITDIYKVAGREEKEDVSSEMLVSALKKKDKNAGYVGLPYDNVSRYIKEKVGANDLVLTLGATEINEVAKGLTSADK